jgi:hypothetical protein
MLARAVGTLRVGARRSVGSSAAQSLVVASGLCVALCGASENEARAISAQATREQLRNIAAAELGRHLRTTDVRTVHAPFDDQDALTEAVRDTLLLSSQDPGILLVTAPSGAGKTTRLRHVCQSLANNGDIRGALFVDFAQTPKDADVRASFWDKLDADGSFDLSDILPEDSAVTVVVLDNVDVPADQDGVLRLVEELVIESTRKKFVLVATTRSDEGARRILKSGLNVRALGSGHTLVHGDPSSSPPPRRTWQSRGLKWSRADCDRLLSAFERQWDFSLAAEAREALLDLAQQAGTPEFVQLACARIGADGVAQAGELAAYVRRNFAQHALDSEAQWDRLAESASPP